jgi:hypothetical protein
LLSLVEHGQQQWRELLHSWGAPEDSAVRFEYRVDSPKAGGNPSQTDALLISSFAVWAVEAKWTEPQYETVAKRLRRLEADGADPRTTLKGWLRHLNLFAARPLHVEDATGVVYQVLHRAASACAVAATLDCKPQLIYLHFHPSLVRSSATTVQYISDLGHLHSVLGSPADVTFGDGSADPTH